MTTLSPARELFQSKDFATLSPTEQARQLLTAEGEVGPVSCDLLVRFSEAQQFQSAEEAFRVFQAEGEPGGSRGQLARAWIVGARIADQQGDLVEALARTRPVLHWAATDGKESGGWLYLHGCAMASAYSYRMQLPHGEEMQRFRAALRSSTALPGSADEPAMLMWVRALWLLQGRELMQEALRQLRVFRREWQPLLKLLRAPLSGRRADVGSLREWLCQLPDHELLRAMVLRVMEAISTHISFRCAPCLHLFVEFAPRFLEIEDREVIGRWLVHNDQLRAIPRIVHLHRTEPLTDEIRCMLGEAAYECGNFTSARRRWDKNPVIFSSPYRTQRYLHLLLDAGLHRQAIRLLATVPEGVVPYRPFALTALQHGLERARAEAEQNWLPETYRAEIAAYLARPDLHLKYFNSYDRVGAAVVQPVVLAVQAYDRWDRLSASYVQAAFEFFAREFGERCPSLTQLEPVFVETPPPVEGTHAWGEELRSVPVPQVAGVTHYLLLDFRTLDRCAIGRAWGRGRSAVRCTHLDSHNEDVVAHELAHSLFGLPDLSLSLHWEDPGSLMGYERLRSLRYAYLPARLKAACLTSDVADHLSRKASRLWCRGRREDGLRLAQQALAEVPWHFQLRFWTALILHGTGRKAEARALSEETARRFAQFGVLLDDHELAGRTRYEGPQLTIPKDRYQLVAWHLYWFRRSEAKRLMRQWNLDPMGCPNVATRWANVVGWDCREAGEQAFRKALRCYPEHADLLFAYGNFLCNYGDTRLARQFYRRAGGPNGPLRPEARLRLAIGQRRWKVALRAAQSLQRPAESTCWHHVVGRIQWRLGDVAAATRTFAEAVRYSPNSAHRAYLAAVQGDVAGARTLAGRAMRRIRWRLLMHELLAFLEPQGGWEERFLEKRPISTSILLGP